MCSINGFLSFTDVDMRLDLRDFLRLSTNRGRDSYGIYVHEPHRPDRILKNINKIVNQSFESFGDLTVKPGTVFMNNMRAEPTSNSEWIKDKTPNDTQPLSDKQSTIIHNGTISNDVKFNKRFVSMVVEYNGQWADQYQDSEIKIDSGIFLNYRTSEALIEGLISGQVIGSFASVQFFKDSGDVIFYKNYMPLYLMIDYTNKFIWWASERETFTGIPQTELGLEYTIIDVPAYSYLVLNIHKTWQDTKQAVNNIRSFVNSTQSNNRSLIVCSGGLDSTTVATLAKRKGEDVTLLHFLYGCRAEVRESEVIPKIAEYLQCRYQFIPITIFHSLLTSSLTERSSDVSMGDIGIEYAYEWVPARNLILMSIAIGYAERYGYSKIYLGANLDEASAFPDNSKDFLDKLACLVPYSVQNGVNIEIERPVANLMKHEIVQFAIDLKAPLHLMWSCYHGGELHCGQCGPCNLRRIAFRKNGLEDQYVQYER